MSKDANLGFDSHYNRRLQDMISNLENMDVLQHQPIMFGGGPLRANILPSGNLGHYPPVEMLAEAKAMGGKISRIKKAKKLTGFAVDTAEKGIGLSKAMGGKISRIKKATKWTDYAVDTANKGIGLASTAKMLGFGVPKAQNVTMGGKISRSKKAAKWTDYAVDTANKGIGLASTAKMLGFGKKPNARAEIVKQVMAKHGMKMIEASKFVKANNLY